MEKKIFSEANTLKVFKMILSNLNRNEHYYQLNEKEDDEICGKLHNSKFTAALRLIYNI